MFSMLLCNVWAIVNTALSRVLHGRLEGLRLLFAKLFIVKFYQASYVDREPPPDDI